MRSFSSSISKWSMGPYWVEITPVGVTWNCLVDDVEDGMDYTWKKRIEIYTDLESDLLNRMKVLWSERTDCILELAGSNRYLDGYITNAKVADRRVTMLYNGASLDVLPVVEFLWADDALLKDRLALVYKQHQETQKSQGYAITNAIMFWQQRMSAIGWKEAWAVREGQWHQPFSHMPSQQGIICQVHDPESFGYITIGLYSVLAAMTTSELKRHITTTLSETRAEQSGAVKDPDGAFRKKRQWY